MVVAIIYNNIFLPPPAYIIIWVLLVLKKMKLIIIYIDIISPIEEFSQNQPTSNRVKNLKTSNEYAKNIELILGVLLLLGCSVLLVFIFKNELRFFK